MRRTQEEIDRQIQGLQRQKETLPEYSRFREPNHRAINAQISILTKESKLNEFEPFINDIAESNDSEDEYIYGEASLAQDWVNGESDEDLFEI